MTGFYKIVALVVACAFAAQSFDAFRSAITETQHITSAPDKHQKAISPCLCFCTEVRPQGESSEHIEVETESG